MQRRGLVLIVFLGMLLMAGAAGYAQQLPEIKYEKYELPNGLDVILHEDHSIPVVGVNIWYHVGSKNEKPGRTGFAHVFEHMMFQGSEHHNTDYFLPLEAIGAFVNGSTDEDRTNYLEDVPSNYLELALWLESDRMGFLVPSMTQERLDNQRGVVQNERREGVENQPYGKVEDLLGPMIFPPHHPYSWSVIGSMEDLSAASLSDVTEFFKRYYTPNNASLCIAGDFDPATVKKLVETYFGPIPSGPDIERMTEWVPQLEGVKRAEAVDNVSLARVYMAWPTPAYYKPGDAELDLLASVLASGKTSRLYKSLVYEQQIAQDISAYQNSREIASVFNIVVTARQGRTLEEIERAVDAELQKILTSGITADELKLAQTQVEASYVRSLEPAGGFGGRANRLNGYNVYLGDPNKLQWDLNRYFSATVAAVNETARKCIDLNRRAILRITPRGEMAAATDETDRTTEPAAGPEPDFRPPAIQRATLANGMELYLVENHKLPVVQANLVFNSGWAADPAKVPGAAALTADMLDEGTKTRSALQISEEARRLAALIGTYSRFDYSVVSLNVLKKNLDPALTLVSDLVLNPAFPEKDLERLRQLYLGRIAQESKDPTNAAFRAFYRELYGEGHPYAQPYTGSGTESSIKALTRDDLMKFHQANYYPNNAAMVVVGDITLADAKARLEKVFQAWKPGEVAKSTIPVPPAPQQSKIYIVDKPGAQQSMVVVGHLGIARNSPDYIACDVMNNALGGQFTSRINMNLREEKGLTYGARSFFSDRRSVGAFAAYAPVQSDATKQTVMELIKELKDARGDRPLSDAELATSRDNLIKQYPQGFESIADIAGQIGSVVINDLPLDLWQTYATKVRGVDTGTATQMAKKYLNPDALLIVVVGDRAKIEPGLRELGISEIVSLSAAEL